LEEYVTAIITLHSQRIGDEENNVKKNNRLAQGGSTRSERDLDLRSFGAVSEKR
jgi:hypothetical protein